MVTTRNRNRIRLTNRGRIVFAIVATLVLLCIAQAIDAASAQGTETATVSAERKAPSSQREAKTRPGWPCTDALARTLRRAGFEKRNHREAWAIAMRESGGQAGLVSYGVDHGLFQFNVNAHSDKPWWNVPLLLTADYNAKIAFETSRGGRDWLMWGLSPTGETDARMYPMWDDDKIYRWITEPFQRYFAQYADLPRACER